MNDFIIESFSITTVEDQFNYFSGTTQPIVTHFIGEPIELPDGNYRVIDNKLLPILSGLSISELRERFDGIKDELIPGGVDE
jgi:hypothetical protein